MASGRKREADEAGLSIAAKDLILSDATKWRNSLGGVSDTSTVRLAVSEIISRSVRLGDLLSELCAEVEGVDAGNDFSKISDVICTKVHVAAQTCTDIPPSAVAADVICDFLRNCSEEQLKATLLECSNAVSYLTEEGKLSISMFTARMANNAKTLRFPAVWLLHTQNLLPLSAYLSAVANDPILAQKFVSDCWLHFCSAPKDEALALFTVLTHTSTTHGSETNSRATALASAAIEKTLSEVPIARDYTNTRSAKSNRTEIDTKSLLTYLRSSGDLPRDTSESVYVRILDRVLEENEKLKFQSQSHNRSESGHPSGSVSASVVAALEFVHRDSICGSANDRNQLDGSIMIREDNGINTPNPKNDPKPIKDGGYGMIGTEDNIAELCVELVGFLPVEKSVDALRKAVERFVEDHAGEIDCIPFTVFVKILLANRPEAAAAITPLVENLLREAFSLGRTNQLLLTILLVRISDSIPALNMSYFDWFASNFVRQAGPIGPISKKQATLLVRVLTNLVPHEPPHILKTHLKLVPDISSIKGTDIASDYQMLVRTRLVDLLGPNALTVNVQATSTGASEPSGASKIREEVEAALQQFADAGKIPKGLLEMSIFKKAHFIQVFLPALLTYTDPDAEQERHKDDLIKCLREARKIPIKLLENPNGKPASAEPDILLDVSAISNQSSAAEAIQSLAEKLALRLESAMGVDGGSQAVQSLLSEGAAALDMALGRAAGGHEEIARCLHVDLRVGSVGREQAEVTEATLNLFCRIMLVVGLDGIANVLLWGDSIASMIGRHTFLHYPLANRLLALLLLYGGQLDSTHARALTILLIHLDRLPTFPPLCLAPSYLNNETITGTILEVISQSLLSNIHHIRQEHGSWPIEFSILVVAHLVATSDRIEISQRDSLCGNLKEVNISDGPSNTPLPTKDRAGRIPKMLLGYLCIQEKRLRGVPSGPIAEQVMRIRSLLTHPTIQPYTHPLPFEAFVDVMASTCPICSPGGVQCLTDFVMKEIVCTYAPNMGAGPNGLAAVCRQLFVQIVEKGGSKNGAPSLKGESVNESGGPCGSDFQVRKASLSVLGSVLKTLSLQLGADYSIDDEPWPLSALKAILAGGPKQSDSPSLTKAHHHDLCIRSAVDILRSYVPPSQHFPAPAPIGKTPAKNPHPPPSIAPLNVFLLTYKATLAPGEHTGLVGSMFSLPYSLTVYVLSGLAVFLADSRLSAEWVEACPLLFLSALFHWPVLSTLPAIYSVTRQLSEVESTVQSIIKGRVTQAELNSRLNRWGPSFTACVFMLAANQVSEPGQSDSTKRTDISQWANQILRLLSNGNHDDQVRCLAACLLDTCITALSMSCVAPLLQQPIKSDADKMVPSDWLEMQAVRRLSSKPTTTGSDIASGGDIRDTHLKMIERILAKFPQLVTVLDERGDSKEQQKATRAWSTHLQHMRANIYPETLPITSLYLPLLVATLTANQKLQSVLYDEPNTGLCRLFRCYSSIVRDADDPLRSDGSSSADLCSLLLDHIYTTIRGRPEVRAAIATLSPTLVDEIRETDPSLLAFLRANRSK